MSCRAAVEPVTGAIVIVKQICGGILILTMLFPMTLWGQAEKEGEPKKEWARSSKKIPFQNDSHWTDNRWQATNVGPFLTASLATPGGPTLKGIAIRVGDRQQAAVCFDTARLRISAAWTGDFLRFGARRFGLIDRPAPAGKLVFRTPKTAGWARGDQFTPQPGEITDLKVATGYTAPGSSVVHLPKDWAAYRGLYTSGQRIVLSYSVAKTDLLESPWYVQAGKEEAFVRSLEIGPAEQILRMAVADQASQVTALGSSLATVSKGANGGPVLVVAPHEKTIRVKLLITSKNVNGEAIQTLYKASGPIENLGQMIKQDRPRWPEELVTRGETTETGGPYVIDTLTLPFENPHKALFFTAGHDFFSNGKAAICTAHGDVWVVSGIDRQLKKLLWRRYATGLFQPLGLKIVDDKVYVICRDQITRLHDRNGDGEADYYENFNNDLFVSPKNHDYVTCLDTDPAGNFYFIHAKTGVMRVSADGSTMSAVGDGFRNPNGMAVGPQGTITASPQQGTWTPESSIFVVKEGGYYGFGGPRVTKERPTGWDLPMCFVPRALDNSGGGQVWVESKRWGPLDGQMLHLSYGQCRLLLTLMEEVNGVYQGGSIKFPTVPDDFESGIMRGRFNPHDGQLYVSGLRGWQTRAVRDGCFQRLRYTGGPVHLPTAVKTYKNGIKLSFPQSLDPEMAGNVDNYFVEQWNYRWTAQYGSPDFSVKNPQQQGRDEISVVSATLMDGGQAIFLEMPGRQPVNQISISWLLNSTSGEHVRGRYAHTINVDPAEVMPEDQIIRRKRPLRIASEVQQRLKPGLLFRFASGTGKSDARTSRMMTLYQSIGQPATPFLKAGPFGLEASGTVRIPLSGFYDFKVTGTGKAQLWVNDRLIVDQEMSSQTKDPILLHKGHNLVRLSYTSPGQGVGQLRLWWKGFKFDWEPVPGDVFFHDSGDGDLVAAQQRRAGRNLFADHHCAKCHQTEGGQRGMFELGLAAPSLATAGDRLQTKWLQQWLLDPQLLRPGAHMPELLTAGQTGQGEAADLAAYLLQQQAEERLPEPVQVSPALLATGQQLFETLGCLNCHHFGAPGKKDEFDRLSLHHANAKYRPGAIIQFLRKPSAHFEATRMPNFHLSADESVALAHFVRSKSPGKIAGQFAAGSATRGEKLFTQKACLQCHRIGGQATKPAQLSWAETVERTGCLASKGTRRKVGVPAFGFNEAQQRSLHGFLQRDLASLQQSSPAETSGRLFERLQCASCHDRDGQRSKRLIVLAEEGGGKVGKVLPQLTWAGEKLQPSWTERLLAGKLPYKSRPWIKDRMPAFPGYAKALSEGLAVEHAVNPHEQEPITPDAGLVAVGEKLTLQTGLDCRQCHGIGDLQPRGDKNTKISQGVNFTYIRDRLRHESYQRFMFDPPRFDINTNMIKLSANGITTKVKQYYDADAHRQFEALWHYIHSLPTATDR